MAMMKGQVYRDLERTLPESLKQATQLMGESFSGPDFTEGVRSFTERRAPDFAPLAAAGALGAGALGAGARGAGATT
jgi:hypothetical protein